LLFIEERHCGFSVPSSKEYCYGAECYEG